MLTVLAQAERSRQAHRVCERGSDGRSCAGARDGCSQGLHVVPLGAQWYEGWQLLPWQVELALCKGRASWRLSVVALRIQLLSECTTTVCRASSGGLPGSRCCKRQMLSYLLLRSACRWQQWQASPELHIGCLTDLEWMAAAEGTAVGAASRAVQAGRQRQTQMVLRSVPLCLALRKHAESAVQSHDTPWCTLPRGVHLSVTPPSRQSSRPVCRGVSAP